MNTSRPAVLMTFLLVLAACSAAGGPPSASPSASPPPPSQGAVTSPEEAAARVQAEYPEFAGLMPLDPELIGACCWYEATAVEGGYQVVITVGWGDCPAGCIDKHRWTFAVAPTGQVALLSEEGPAVPADVMPGGPG